MQDNTKLEIIKKYLVDGYHLIPLHYPSPDGCSCYKGSACPQGTRGKHPRDADWTNCANHVTTFEQAQNIWGVEGNPSFNVGIVTGECSGIVVLDIDGETGRQSLQKLIEDTGQDLTLTRTHKTGSGGLHLIFEEPEGFYLTNSNKNLKRDYPGIDIRGNGGQIVTCPSVSGKGDYSIVNQNQVLRLGSKTLEKINTPTQNGKLEGTPRDTVQPHQDLPTQVQEECDRYALSALQNELQRFESEYGLPNWDDLVNQVAFNAMFLAYAPWNSLDVDDVFEEVFDAAPRGGDADWTESRIQKCVTSAYNAVLAREDTRPLPKQQQEALRALENGLNPEKLQQDLLDASLVDWEEAFDFDPDSIEFLPGGFARAGDYVSIIGDGKVGKSVFCHDWAWRMATGQHFLGKSMSGPLPVLYLDRENDKVIYTDHFRSYGATPQTMGDLKFLSFPQFPGLDTPQGGRTFVDLVKRSGAKVVFIDTISRFVEGEENDNNTWLKVYIYSIVPLRDYDDSITIIRIDHFGKDKTKGGRGGSAKEQDVSNVYEMKKTNKGFVLERTHTRSGIGPETVAFYRTGRALEKMWAPGETSHELIPNWSIPKGPGHIDKTSVEEMVKHLDDNCIPDGHNGWGVNKAEKILRDAGFKGSKSVLDSAQKQRKNRGEYEMICPHGCDLR
jgi:hypothetical protein